MFPDINLKLTMESGQPPHFIWNFDQGGYSRDINGKLCRIWQDGELKCNRGFEGYVASMLRLSDDLDAIVAEMSTDDVLKKAAEKYHGLRVTKSDPWETLVCFICSAINSIPRIRLQVQAMMRDGVFPSPEKMSKTDLRKYGLGFRAKSLNATAGLVAHSFDLPRIGRMRYDDAKETLKELPGVGSKVADCVLLMGYGFLEAFPVDVWIRRAMEKYYLKGRKLSDEKIAAFARDRWGRCAGYANGYLFCYARDTL